MTTDYRSLCEELLSALENEGYAHWVVPPNKDELCLRSRAALDEPVEEGPTLKEVSEWIDREYSGSWNFGAQHHDAIAVVLAALHRWGYHTQPTSGEEPLGSDGGYEAGSMWIGHGTRFTLGDKITEQEVFGEPNDN